MYLKNILLDSFLIRLKFNDPNLIKMANEALDDIGLEQKIPLLVHVELFSKELASLSWRSCDVSHRHLQIKLTCEKSDVLNAFPKTKWDKETPPLIVPCMASKRSPVFQGWQSRLEVVLYLWYEMLNGLKIQTCSCVRWKCVLKATMWPLTWPEASLSPVAQKIYRLKSVLQLLR